MPYKLPRQYKWKGRKRQNDRWSYFVSKRTALEYSKKEDFEHLKRVHAGT